MNQLFCSMWKLAAIGSAVALAACGGSQTPEPSSPSSAQMTPPTTQQYGATMSQPSAPPSEPTATSRNPAPTYGPPATIGSASHAGGTESQTGNAGGETRASGAFADVANFDDADVAAVLQAMNSGEIQQAKLAQNEATSPDVKRFAQKMLMAHREMQTSDATLFSRLKLTPKDNSMSNELKTEAQSELSTLRDESGKNFDREYMDGQVLAHKHALELFDRMLTTTKGFQLRDELQNARPKIQEHLRDAERIQQDLAKGLQSQPAPKQSIPAPSLGPTK